MWFGNRDQTIGRLGAERRPLLPGWLPVLMSDTEADRARSREANTAGCRQKKPGIHLMNEINILTRVSTLQPCGSEP